MKIHSSCEIEDFVETHLRKLCVIYSDRAYYGLCVLIEDFVFFFIFSHFYFPAPGQAVVTGVVPSPPRFLPSIFIVLRVLSNPTARRFFIECC